MKPSSHRALRGELACVRGLGSAKDGTHHFIWQRITAIALAPLVVWFVYSLMNLAMSGSQESVAEWLARPGAAIVLSLFLIALFYHAKLGVQVVIEDYVHTAWLKITLLLANMLIFSAFTIISLFAVLKLHFLDVLSTGV